MSADLHSLAQRIDHTLLRPTATEADYAKLCAEAQTWKFFSVCVPPTMVPFCSQQLADAEVKVCTVVGFPTGSHTMLTKAFEAREAIQYGASEIDMVANLAWIKMADWTRVEQDIASVVEASAGRVVKVIIETHLLNDQEKVRAVQAVIAAGATYVKTSTGFSGGGATIEDIRVLVAAARGQAAVKASGGIRDLETLRLMVNTGAQRIGTSSGVKILSGESGSEAY